MGLVVYSERALLFMGTEGSDAGGWRFNPRTGKWEKVPGWEADRFRDILSAISVLDKAAAFVNPRLIDSVSTPLAQFVHEEISSYVGEVQ